jgi:hypothetical protein
MFGSGRSAANRAWLIISLASASMERPLCPESGGGPWWRSHIANPPPRNVHHRCDRDRCIHKAGGLAIRRRLPTRPTKSSRRAKKGMDSSTKAHSYERQTIPSGTSLAAETDGRTGGCPTKQVNLPPWFLESVCGQPRRPVGARALETASRGPPWFLKLKVRSHSADTLDWDVTHCQASAM